MKREGRDHPALERIVDTAEGQPPQAASVIVRVGKAGDNQGAGTADVARGAFDIADAGNNPVGDVYSGAAPRRLADSRA